MDIARLIEKTAVPPVPLPPLEKHLYHSARSETITPHSRWSHRGILEGSRRGPMSARKENERPLTRRFWEKRGGILIEEFPAVPQDRRNGHEHRNIDGVIVYSAGRRRVIEKGDALEVDGKRIRDPKGTNPCKIRIRVKGKRIVVIQTKASPLSMSLLGQTLFSGHLMEKFEPSSIEMVALCTKSDTVLGALAERYNIRVEVEQE